MADRLRIVNGRVYDPINGVDGAVREICIEDGKVVASVPADSLVALARLAELITRPDVLTIVQDDYEIRVDRKDDFSMLCAFYDGVATSIESDLELDGSHSRR